MSTTRKGKQTTVADTTDISASDIAIIGMSCRFPGARNHHEFWQNIISGKNSISVIPEDRWDWRQYYGDPQKDDSKTNSKWGGFIEDVDKFDPLFFNISPNEANAIDPQHRLFLQEAWHAVEDAGYCPSQLSGRKIGVYAGVSKNDYAEMLGENISAFVSTGTVHSILVNRISYLFDFRGPSIAFDTACSSSLVALHNAIRDIEAGECDAALVGGVNAILSPRMYISHAQSGMLSPDGQCHSFDQAANGYVRGEGVGVILIKSLSSALAAEDNIIGVIKATAINHGGRANFLTAPNVAAQQEVVFEALRKSNVNPNNIGYIETHGTGTALGDPIEINGLKKAYAQYSQEKKIKLENANCALGTVKTNIGHLESAAGIAGLVKIILAMRHAQIPKLLNFKKLNPYIELHDSPFFIADQVIDWPRDKQTAGLSSFGMGGVNAHVIVAAPPGLPSRKPLPKQHFPILLSAKKGQLKTVAGQLLTFLSERIQELECRDIAYTLMVGREPLTERLAFMAHDNNEICRKLQNYLENKPLNDNELPGAVKEWLTRDDAKLAAPTFKGRRIALPTYPFKLRRCWFQETAKESVKQAMPTKSIVLSHDDTFVRDHLVQEQATLPGMAYIALLRKLLRQENRHRYLFKEVFWLKPLQFDTAEKNLILEFDSNGETIDFTARTEGEEHCKGSLVKMSSAPQKLTTPDLSEGIRLSKADLYQEFKQHGLDYGNSLQLLEEVILKDHEAIATIKQNGQNDTAILDSALQTAVALTIHQEDNPTEQFLPYFAESIELAENLTAIDHLYVKLQQLRENLLVFDIHGCANDGEVLAKFSSFKKRIFHAQPNLMHYYVPDWAKQENQSHELPEGVLLVNAQKGLDKRLIQERNIKVKSIPNSPKSFEATCVKYKKKGGFDHILFFANNPGTEELTSLLQLIQGVMRSKWREIKQISYVGLDLSQEQECVFYAAAGLARTTKYEYPQLRVNIIGLYDTPLSLSMLNQSDTPLQEIRYRNGQREFRLMQQVAVKDISKEEIPFKEDGTYLIAGGAGGLGKIFSEWVAQYQVNLILLGRSSENDAIRQHLQLLREKGSQATYLAVDVTDLNALKTALKPFDQINGVIHAAGLIEDKYIFQKTVESFRKVLAPKIAGTQNLDQATQQYPLDFFVLFSSVAAIIPNQGQCDYGSANTFLDYYANYRQHLFSEGKRQGMTVSINWPLWADGGMQVTEEEKQHLWSVFGMQPLSTPKGVEFFRAAVMTGRTQLLGISGDPEKIQHHFKTSFVAVRSEEELLKQQLNLIVALAFKRRTETLSQEISFNELGVESVSLVTLTNLINNTYQLDIKPTLFFEYDNLKQLWEYLRLEYPENIAQRRRHLGELLQTYDCDSLIDIEQADLGKNHFQRRFTNQEFYMVDHVVAGQYNVPGACYIEMARQAAALAKPGRKVTQLINNYWSKQLSSTGPAFIAHIQLIDNNENIDYEIYSLDDDQQKNIHASGTILYDTPAEERAALDLQAIRQRCQQSRSRQQVYEQIHAEDLKVGPSFMPMHSIVLNEKEALAQISLPAMVEDTWQDYLLHPTMLTGVFQTALINNRADGDDHRQFIPIGMDRVALYSIIPPTCYVYSQRDEGTKNNESLKKFDVSVCDEKGRILLRLENFAIKARPGSHVDAPQISSTSYAATAIAEATEDWLKKLLAPVIGLSSHEIQATDAFEDYGINSVMVLKLNKLMAKEFGGGLSKTLFFEYQTIAELSRYLVEEHKSELERKLPHVESQPQPLRDSPEPATLPTEDVQIVNNKDIVSERSQANGDIAIIGVAGRYPKANNLQEFWYNLIVGRDCIEEIPPDRFDAREYGEKLVGRWGSFIDDVDKFDPLFFNISPKEAELIDPQERLFLQIAWQCIEDAGYNRKQLSDQDVAVYVGALWQPYLEQAIISQQQGNIVGPSSLLYSIANRVSYFFDFSGPSMAVDTACSSSLTALHLACQSLNKGECTMAFAGGVNLSVGASKYLFLNQYNFLSNDGRCRSFGADGDGYVPGEGIGTVLLKPLEDAVRDNDHIYAVIKATAINHGGKTNGFTVPNPKAQTNLIKQTLARAKIDPGDISYVEAHGTGTALGDPIELNSLTQAFRQKTDKKQYCVIGSVKSNIGHLEASAGIAGLTKILLQMKHGKIVPSLHSKKLNPHIDFAHSPFEVAQQLTDWQSEGKRIAAISSFGAGGSNAHAIIEEYLPPPAPEQTTAVIPQNAGVIIPLSARTTEQLKQKARELLDYICNEAQSIDLIEMAYTLQVGREAMEERLGFMVSSVEQLAEKLRAYIDEEQPFEDFYQGQVRRNKDLSLFNADEDMQKLIDQWIAPNKLSKLLNLWVNGLDFDWHKLYGDTKPRRISLPPYPFAKERYWLDVNIGQRATTGAISSALHPLLHSNTSDLSQQSYSSNFSGKEFFLTDHQVNGEKVLPAVAYLEMARAAVAQALPTQPESTILELRNIVWTEPIVVTENKRVSIVLLADHAGQIEYEIQSTEAEACRNIGPPEEIIHCQGKAVFSNKPAPVPVDIPQLQGQMQKIKLEPESLYGAFNKMGINYGPAFQGIRAVYQGDNQVLAELNLSTTPEDKQNDYVLHPGVMDSALQASIGLIADLNHLPGQPLIPFALEELHIISACNKEMVAWVRYSQGSRSKDKTQDHHVVKLDIDLLDPQGNVCVQMLGFSFENMANNLEYMLQKTGKDWFSLREEWVISPLKTEVEAWSEKIEAKKDHRILVISKDKDDYDALKIFCQEIAKVLKDREDLWRIRYLPIPGNSSIQEVDIEPHLTDTECPQTIFLFLPKIVKKGRAQQQLELIYSCIQSLMQAAATKPIQFYCCYQDEPSEQSLYREGLVGLFKSAMLENLHHRYRSIAYDSQMISEGTVALRMIEEWLCDDTMPMNAAQVPMVHFCKGDRFELQFNEMEFQPLNQPAAFREGATYLMVGALGEVGELICQQLGRHYHAQLVILSRRDENEVKESLARIEKAGASVMYRSVDIFDLKALKKAMQSLKKEGVIIQGVIHMARRVLDAPIMSKPFREFSETMSAKVQGTLNIDAVTAKEPLEFFMVYSSAAALGIKGSPDYAYSTAFQNAFVRYRNRLLEQKKRTGRALAICWGQWEIDGGVAPEKMPQRLNAMRQMGMDFIDASSAMTVMEVSLSNQSEVVGFIAAHDKENVIEMMGLGQQTYRNNGRIDSMIDAFEKEELSKSEFIKFLDTLTDCDFTDSVQEKIIQAIRRYERNGTERVEGGSLRPRNFKTPPKRQPQQPSRIRQSETIVMQETESGRKPVSKLITQNLQKVLGIKDDVIDLDKSFQDYGLDSITAAQLTAALEKELEFSIPPNWLIEYATINALTERLNQETKNPELVS